MSVEQSTAETRLTDPPVVNDPYRPGAALFNFAWCCAVVGLIFCGVGWYRLYDYERYTEAANQIAIATRGVGLIALGLAGILVGCVAMVGALYQKRG